MVLVSVTRFNNSVQISITNLADSHLRFVCVSACLVHLFTVKYYATAVSHCHGLPYRTSNAYASNTFYNSLVLCLINNPVLILILRSLF